MTTALVAARLALMAARACATGGTETRADVVCLAPGAEPRTVDAAAAVLAALPKPVRLTCEVRDGLLSVHPTPLPPEPPEPVEPPELVESPEPAGPPDPLPDGVLRVAEHPEHRMMGFLHEAHGPDIEHLAVACLGVGESLRATVGDVRAWDRDYQYHEPAGRCSVLALQASDLPQPSRPELFRDVPAAVMDGAVAFVRYIAADEEDHHLWFLAPDSSPAMFCDDCGVRRATTRAGDREQGYWRERYRCGPCGWADDVTPGVDPEWFEADTLALLEREGGEDALADLADGLVRMAEKSGLAMPPYVAAFVERHRAE